MDVYDLAGRAVLGLGAGLAEGDRRTLLAEMDPFVPVDAVAAAPGVVVDRLEGDPVFADVQGPARDELTTAWAGGALHLIEGGSWCRLPDPLDPGPLTIALGPGFGAGQMVRPVLRPALQLAILRRGAAAVHSAAVDLDGSAVLVAGWSETGKTEGALAFVERGAGFFSDKWTVCSPDGTATAFPIGVGIRRWVLPHLPKLAAALPRRARGQMAAAASLDTASRPLRARARGRVTGLAAGAVGRAVTLADRAGLSPTEVLAAYDDHADPGRTLPLKGVVLLRTVYADHATAAPMDPVLAAARLARSAAYERRSWFNFVERAHFADPGRADADSAAAWIAEEEAVLARAFANVPVVGLDVAFPADPGQIVDAALPHLT